MLLVDHLQLNFTAQRNEGIAAQQSAYMRNLFPFLGLKKPLRDALQKETFKKYPLTTEKELIEAVTLLWQLNEREYQYAALDLAYKYKKLWTQASFALFEQLIRSKSWWDTVDYLAPKHIGTYARQDAAVHELMDRWIDDEYLWIRRAAIIYQLTYKENTHHEKLFIYCKKRMHEKEFFIQKAIGWALREYAYTNGSAVAAFLLHEKSSLAPLSFREAGKYCLKSL